MERYLNIIFFTLFTVVLININGYSQTLTLKRDSLKNELITQNKKDTFRIKTTLELAKTFFRTIYFDFILIL